MYKIYIYIDEQLYSKQEAYQLTVAIHTQNGR